MFLHPENAILHEARHMLQYCNTVWFCNCKLFLRNCDAFRNHEELEKVKRALKDKPGSNKVNLGRRVWSQSNQWPRWDAISKGLIWCADEWKSFQIIMAKPVIQRAFIASAEDKERTLTLGEGDNQQISKSS